MPLDIFPGAAKVDLSSKSQKADALIQETTLQNPLEVTKILQICLKKFCEFRQKLPNKNKNKD
jgi:hypothetical protein